MKSFTPFVFFLCLLSAAVSAQWVNSQSANTETGFISMFNGNDLSEWEGSRELWLAVDGMIVGETATEGAKKISYNQFFIWKGGDVSNFVMRFDARVTSGGNSGIQYRSWLNPDKDKPYSVFGYQCDFDGVNRSTGKIYGENYRQTLAYRGTRAEVGDDHKPREVERFMEDAALQSLISTNDWNSFEVIADGFTFMQKVNGHLTCVLTDNDKEMRRTSGIIAIQLHAGPAMKVELRNLRLLKKPDKMAIPEERTETPKDKSDLPPRGNTK